MYAQKSRQVAVHALQLTKTKWEIKYISCPRIVYGSTSENLKEDCPIEERNGSGINYQDQNWIMI